MTQEPDKVRAPSIRDVARLADVSHQTVSRVLNNHPSIRESTRQRVLQVMKELQYRPNPAARALVTSRSRTIGILTSQTSHHGPATSVAAIETAARAAGYLVTSTSLTATDSDAITAGLQQLMKHAVEGIVIIAPQERVVETLQRLQIEVPFVALHSTNPEHPHSLTVDQVAGAYTATKHLISLGHTEILHIAGPQDWIEAEARMQGYLNALGDADLRTRAPILGDWSAQFGYYAGRELLTFRDFTAVFAANDQMALGVIHACHEAGIDVPGQISVVGFDDVPEAAHFWPPLTTVRQDFAEIGRRAVAMLLDEIRGDIPAARAPVETQFIQRRSTGPAAF